MQTTIRQSPTKSKANYAKQLVTVGFEAQPTLPANPESKPGLVEHSCHPQADLSPALSQRERGLRRLLRARFFHTPSFLLTPAFTLTMPTDMNQENQANPASQTHAANPALPGRVALV